MRSNKGILLSILLVVAGLGLIVVGALQQNAPDYSTFEYNQVLLEDPSCTNCDSTKTQIYWLEVKVIIKYPTRINVDRSFTIELVSQIVDVGFKNFNNALLRYDEVNISPEQRNDFITYLRERGSPSFQLNLPGMEFYEDVSTPRNGLSKWVIRPKTSGKFVGLITPKGNEILLAPEEGKKPLDSPRERAMLFKISPEDALQIAIEVTNSILESMSSVFIYVFGPLLTLPGIWAFIREFKPWFEERRKAKRSNIIIP